MKKKIMITIGTILFLVIGFSLYKFNQNLNKPIMMVENPMGTPAETAAVVEKIDIKSIIQANGNVRAEETEEYPIEAGKKVQYYVEDGQEVTKGQLLFEIIDKDLELQYKQALREKSLYPSTSSVTPTPNAVTGSEINNINAQIIALQEKIEANKIKASFKGIVSIINSNGSNQENIPLVIKLSNPGSLIIPINIEEVDYPLIRKGQNAAVKLTAYGNRIFTGKVVGISKEAVTKDGIVTIPCIIKLDQNPSILPGMSAEVNILINSKENVLALPLEFIQEDETGQSYVNIINNDKDRQNVEKRIIKVGIKNDKYAEIISGVKEGERVHQVQ